MSGEHGTILDRKTIQTRRAVVEPPGRKYDSRHRKLVSLIRWFLPLVLFCIVVFYETDEHIIAGDQPFLDTHLGFGFMRDALKDRSVSYIHFTSEILFFGILGPFAVFVALTYMRNLMAAQWRTQARLDEMNQSLQQKVTERTAELEARNAELRQLDDLKSNFVSLVSHELRAPLTTLQGGLELALQQPENLPEDARRILEVMQIENQRLTAFIQRILDLSRLEAGRLPVNLGPVSLRPLLRRSADVIIGDTRLIKWELPAELPLPMGDEIHLEEAIRNLLSNAHKYAPPDTPIHIRIQQIDSCLTVDISDHGPGIPADAQQRIFDRFYRGVDKRDVQDSPGWGLGLYLARWLVEAQGGRLKIQSPAWPDQGSPGATFTVALPLDVEGGTHHGECASD